MVGKVSVIAETEEELRVVAKDVTLKVLDIRYLVIPANCSYDSLDGRTSERGDQIGSSLMAGCSEIGGGRVLDRLKTELVSQTLKYQMIKMGPLSCRRKRWGEYGYLVSGRELRYGMECQCGRHVEMLPCAPGGNARKLRDASSMFIDIARPIQGFGDNTGSSISQFSRPADTVMIAAPQDVTGRNIGYSISPLGVYVGTVLYYGWLGALHSGGANVLFADGHLKWMQETQLDVTVNGLADWYWYKVKT